MTAALKFQIVSRPFAAGIVVVLGALFCVPAASSAQSGMPTGKKKAVIISVSARAALDKAEYEMAAKLYYSAFEADPATLGYLYSAARAWQKGGKLDAAERDYKRFLKLAKASDAALSEKVKRRLVEIDAARKEAALKKRLADAEKARKAAEKKLVVVNKPAPPPERSNVVAYSALGGGVVAIAAGVAAIVSGQSSWDAALSKMPNDDGSLKKGQTELLTYEQAQQAASDAQLSRIVGGALAGVGVAAVAWSAWNLLDGGDKNVALVPTTSFRGAAVTVRF